MSVERERWIDSWKGLLILLVVLGHVVGMMSHFTTGRMQDAFLYAYRFIYFFHMPAFFMLVGVIAGAGEKTDEGLSFAFIARKFKRLMIPYFFWGVVSVLIFLLMTALTSGVFVGNGYYRYFKFDFPWWQPFLSLLHAGFWPNGDGFRCNSVLWFLPCMFLVLLSRKAIQGFNPKSNNTTIPNLKSNNLKSNNLTIPLLLLCLTLGGVLRLYAGLLPWCLDRVPRFLAFVLLGEFVARWRWSIGCGWQIAGLLVGWAIFAAGVVVLPDFGVMYVSWAWYFAEAGMAVLGCVLSMGVARLVDCRLLAGLGVASLGIMLTHKFPIVAIQAVIGKCDRLTFGSVATGLLIAFGIAVLVTALAWGVARVMPRSVGGTKG